MRALTLKWLMLAALLAGPLVSRCSAQATLAWNPSTDPTALGYYIVWGLSSGVYTSTNVYPATQISATVTGLAPNQVYYFNVAAFNSNGPTPFATEVVFTNTMVTSNNSIIVPITGTGSTSQTSGTGTSSSTSQTSGTGTGSSSQAGGAGAQTANMVLANPTGTTTTGGASGTGVASGTNPSTTTTANPTPNQLTLAWNPSTDPTVLGYYIVWGLDSGDYTSTNTYGATQTSATVTGLAPNEVYYFNVAAFNSNGVTPFGTEVVFTNISLDTNQITSVSNLPPFPMTNMMVMSSNIITSTNITRTTNSTTSTNVSQTTTTNQTPNTNLVQSLFWGVPPNVTMVLSNGEPNLNIGATVGATMLIQTTSDLTSVDSWSEVTNVSVTNIAPVALTNPPSETPDALDLAFVPGVQSVAVPATNSAPQFFRVLMPYDYVILAGIVLPTKNYTPRLIVVNMPGIICDDACYVNESSSFIHFDRNTYALQLQGSGSTIRQIATQLANSLSLDWTSASEFTYSNGLGQILATVVATESPSSDPVAGQATPSPAMVINF